MIPNVDRSLAKSARSKTLCSQARTLVGIKMYPLSVARFCKRSSWNDCLEVIQTKNHTIDFLIYLESLAERSHFTAWIKAILRLVDFELHKTRDAFVEVEKLRSESQNFQVVMISNCLLLCSWILERRCQRQR